MKDFARFCQLAVLLVSSGELVPELEGFLAYGLFAEDAFDRFDGQRAPSAPGQSPREHEGRLAVVRIARRHFLKVGDHCFLGVRFGCGFRGVEKTSRLRKELGGPDRLARARKSSCCFRDVVRLGIDLGRATVLAGALPRRGGIEGLTSFRISNRCPAMPLQLFEQERGRLELTAL